MDDFINLEDVPIHIEGVNLPSIPSTSNDPLIEETLNTSDHENSDATDMDDEDISESVTRDVSKLPPHLKGLMGEANLRYARGDHETAKRMCYEVIRQAPAAFEPYFTLAQMYQTSNVRKYKAFLMLANHLHPSHMAVTSSLVDLFVQEGELIEAIRCYSRAIKHNPRIIFFHEKRLELFVKGGMKKYKLFAKVTMARYLPKKNHDRIIQLSMEAARELFLEKSYTKAIEALKIPIKNVPTYVTRDVINMILELLLLCDRFSECVDIFAQFCEFSFDVIVDESNNIIITSYVMPDNLEIDLKTKFVICLVKLKADHLFRVLLDRILMDYDPEEVGDLFIDISEALMQMSYYLDALKFLMVLTKTKNFSLAAVWLKFAECLSACNMPEQAIEAYFTVKTMAPSHVEVLFPLAMLLLKQNKRNEALEVMSQDLTSNRLDVAVLIEHIKLLKQIDDWEGYCNNVELLLSRHCIVFKHWEELQVARIIRMTNKIAAVKRLRGIMGEDYSFEPQFESIREPSIEEEYCLFRDTLQTTMDRKDYEMMQKFSFMGLCSKKFNRYFYEITLSAFYAAYFNTDILKAYQFIRDLLLKYPNHNLCWNLFTLVTATAQDVRHLRFLDRHSRILPYETSKLIQANHVIGNGHYVNPLNYFMKEFKRTRSAYCAFMMSICMLQYYNQRLIDKSQKKAVAETITALLLNYSKVRTKKVEQEILYNLGRMYQALGVQYLAEHYYKKVLKCDNELMDKYPECLSLRQEAAYNLHVLYKNSGNFIAARKVLYENIVI